MPLIVENGTMPAGANSYVSLESADAYLVPRGLWPLYEGKKDDEDSEGNQEPDAPIDPSGPDSPDNGDTEGPNPEDGEDNNNETAAQSESLEDTETGSDGDNDENPVPDDPEPGPDEPDNQEPELPDTSKPDDDPEIAKKEAALIRAFDYLNGPLAWKGSKVDWQRMAAWPRINVPIPGSNPKRPEYIPDDIIPEAICRAQMELAAFFYNGRDLFSPIERGGKYTQKSDSTSQSVDVLSESESHSIAYSDNAPIDDFLPSIYPLLRPYLEEVPGEVQSGFHVHAILRG